MHCPYCLEPLRGGRACRACGNALPTDSVSEPEAGALWAGVRKLGALLVPVLSFLVFLLAAMADKEELEALKEWVLRWLE